MPQPTLNSVHVDAILTNISVAYMQRQENFIADKVFPIVAVDKKSDKFFTYTKNDWFRDEAQRRADGTESAGSGYSLTTGSYSADVWAFHKDVGDQTLANADAPLNPLREAAEFVTHRLMLRRELQFVSDFFTTGVWGTDETGVSGTPSTGEFKQWSDYANSDPIDNIEEGKEGILSTTGLEANTLVLGYQVFRQLKNHPDVVDRIKYTSSQTVTAEMLARMFEVDRVLVAKAVKATNNEGATGAYGFAYGKSALLCHVAPSAGLLTPSAGYTFAWTGVSGGMGTTMGTSQFRLEHLKAERVEGEIAFDNKVVGADLGYFFTSAVA
jgi:hypothetical protein